MTHHSLSGSKPARPSPARLEWLQIKAEVEREAKEKARAARLAASAEQRTTSDGRPATRIWRETRQALAEIGRNRRRWENA
jgi:hypothetical protein